MGNVWSGNTKSWQNVRSYDDFSVGDELCYWYFPIYRWGIVTSKKPCGEFCLVGFHLKISDGVVRKENYNFHIDGFRFQKASYQRQLNNEEAAQNALSRLGENEYNGFTNFARAFTRWCKTGSRDILSSRHDIRAKEEVTLGQLKKYDHIVIYIQNHYHHGLVLECEPSRSSITIIHYSDVTSGGSGTHRPYKSTLRYRSGHLMRIKYSKPDKTEVIMRRIDLVLEQRAWVDKKGAKETSGTCEQFATWLITGKKPQTQVTLSDAIAELEENERQEGRNHRAGLSSQRSMPNNSERLPLEKIQDFLVDRLRPLIGMDSTKRQVNEYVVTLIGDALRLKEGVARERKRPVICLLGNPGTAKTFVAQQLAEVMFHLCLINSPSLDEVNAETLKGGTTNQTLSKTIEVIDNARGGVLMVKDFPQLGDYPSGDLPIKAFMETVEEDGHNVDDRPAYIFAGTKYEMEGCLKTHQELAKKNQALIEFADYTEEELARILETRLKWAGLVFEGQRDWLCSHIKHHFNAEQRVRHNARLCDMVVTKTRTNMDSRVARLLTANGDVDAELLNLPSKGDVEAAIEQVAAHVT